MDPRSKVWVSQWGYTQSGIPLSGGGVGWGGGSRPPLAEKIMLSVYRREVKLAGRGVPSYSALPGAGGVGGGGDHGHERKLDAEHGGCGRTVGKGRKKRDFEWEGLASAYSVSDAMCDVSRAGRRGALGWGLGRGQGQGQGRAGQGGWQVARYTRSQRLRYSSGEG